MRLYRFSDTVKAMPPLWLATIQTILISGRISWQASPACKLSCSGFLGYYAYRPYRTVIGFALMAFTDHTASRLIGYYLTGSSNAVFVLGLSLISGNVGGTTKKVLSSAAIFLGVALGNIVGPYSFLDSGT
jgi:hypothetical protein